MTEPLVLGTILPVFVPAATAFFIGIAMTPFVTHYLYKYKMWKPRAGKTALDGTAATTFNALHATKETGTPRFGGIIVWGSVLATATLLQLLWWFFPDTFQGLAFISRAQTWLPLAALVVGAAVGFLDDLFEVRGEGGLRLRTRLAAVGAVAIFCAWWFYAKLGVSAISFPLVDGALELGFIFVPFFILVTLFIYASGVIDGIDGLSGGVFSTIFAAYAGIALLQGQPDIAAFCAAVAGGLLAFLWFNIPPARFYLTETGTMALTLALTIVAFLTDQRGEGEGITILPIVGFLLMVTVFSNVAQISSKKFFGRKLLRIAPLHHHFEALGWPSYKVTMRYWIVGVVAAIIGLSVVLL